jgi:hypothetical protein
VVNHLCSCAWQTTKPPVSSRPKSTCADKPGKRTPVNDRPPSLLSLADRHLYCSLQTGSYPFPDRPTALLFLPDRQPWCSLRAKSSIVPDRPCTTSWQNNISPVLTDQLLYGSWQSNNCHIPDTCSFPTPDQRLSFLTDRRPSPSLTGQQLSCFRQSNTALIPDSFLVTNRETALLFLTG